MKTVLVGTSTIDGRQSPVWELVRGVLHSLGPSDVLIHTGGRDTLGSMVDYVVRSARSTERRRLPKVDVQLPEIGKYDHEQALRANAAQLLHHHMPDAVVYIGDGIDAETKPVLELVGAYPRIHVHTAEEFIAERGRRG